MKMLFLQLYKKFIEAIEEVRIFVEHFYHFFQIKLNNEDPHKLHFGCGDIRLKGFENIDVSYTPAIDHILDLRRRLPYKTNSVQFIFSEHVFEHIEMTDLRFLFSECYRVLQKGGQLSFSIPDFGKLTIGLLSAKTSVLANAYKKDLIRFKVQFTHLPTAAQNVYYLNHLIHQHGEHKFFYTLPVLREMLAAAGFRSVHKRAWNKKYDSKERRNSSLFVMATK